MNEEGGALKTVERYDADKNVWTEVAPMSVGRWAPGVAVLKGMLYAIGGVSL